MKAFIVRSAILGLIMLNAGCMGHEGTGLFGRRNSNSMAPPMPQYAPACAPMPQCAPVCAPAPVCMPQ